MNEALLRAMTRHQTQNCQCERDVVYGRDPRVCVPRILRAHKARVDAAKAAGLKQGDEDWPRDRLVKGCLEKHERAAGKNWDTPNRSSRRASKRHSTAPKAKRLSWAEEPVSDLRWIPHCDDEDFEELGDSVVFETSTAEELAEYQARPEPVREPETF